MKTAIKSVKWIALLAMLSILGLGAAHPDIARARRVSPSEPASVGVPAPAAATGAASLFGIDEGGILTRNATARTLAVAAGAHWTRMEINWSAIEATRGTYDFYGTDLAVAPILASGLAPVIYISYNPGWASSLPCAPIDTTDQSLKDSYYNFIYATVTHYKTLGDVPIWALYNEEDATNGNADSTGRGCFGSNTAGGINNNGVRDYEEYAIMLSIAWKAVHAADSDAKLAVGALAFDSFRKGNGYNCPANYPGNCDGGEYNYDFPSNLFGYMAAHPLSNGQQYMDMVLFNYYEIYAKYWQTKAKGHGIQSKTNMLKSLMTQAGITPVDLFVTETGEYSDDWKDPQGNNHTYIGLTGQAHCMTITMSRGAAAGLKGVVWWTFKDNPKSDPWPQYTWTYGIVNENLGIKPSYTAMQTIATELNNYNFNKDFSNKKTFKGLESYLFKNGTSKKYTIWSSTINTNTYNPDRPDCSWPRLSKTATFKAKSIRVVDYLGASKTILDNKKGDKDKTVGFIAIKIAGDPKIVQINP